MPIVDQEAPQKITETWRVVTNIGDYTVICLESELHTLQRDYIQKMKDAGVDLKHIRFIWDRTKIVPLTGVR
jgi:hypothetical protein